jgi:hypothetical protein
MEINRRVFLKTAALGTFGVVSELYAFGQNHEGRDPYADAQDIGGIRDIGKYYGRLRRTRDRGEIYPPEFRDRYTKYDNIYRLDAKGNDDIVVVSYFMHTPPDSDASTGYWGLVNDAKRNADADLSLYLTFMKSGGRFDDFMGAKRDSKGDRESLWLSLNSIMEKEGLKVKKLRKKFSMTVPLPLIQPAHVNVSRSAVLYTNMRGEEELVRMARGPLQNYAWL